MRETLRCVSQSPWVEQYAEFTVHAKDDSAWTWEGPKTREVDSELVVGALLDRFEPHAASLAEARSRLGLTYGVGLIIEMHGHITQEAGGGPDLHISTPALSLSADVMTRMVALHCSLDVDQYVYT